MTTNFIFNSILIFVFPVRLPVLFHSDTIAIKQLAVLKNYCTFPWIVCSLYIYHPVDAAFKMSFADSQILEDSQPMRKQDLFSPTLWLIWAQIWNQWTKFSQDQLKFWVIPTFYPCRPSGQPWAGKVNSCRKGFIDFL